jgi:small subunit ribosomal protein S4
MGKPKFSRKRYETPSHPWQEDRIKDENELIKKYGLKNKQEVWRTQTKLRRYRTQARELLAKVETGDEQSKKESNQLLMHLNSLNILPPNSTLDDVLTLSAESILSRRLQTLTYLKGLANTTNQARQLVIHGHIAIGERRVTVPGYIVTKNEEGEISYTNDSPLNDVMHPARPRADFKTVPVVKKEVPKEEKPPEPPKKEEVKKEEKPKEEPPKEETPKEKEKTTETTGEVKKEEKPKEEPPKEKMPREEKPKEEATKPVEQKNKSKEQSEKKEEDKKEGD